ncbi:major facilitator superfamily protein [Hirsutella rhossiliensis]
MAITSRDQVSSMTTALPVTTAEVESHPVPVSSKADEAGADRSQHGTLVVAFNEPFDASNPKQWPRRRKWAVTNVLSASGFNRILVSTIMAPALPIIASEFDMSSAEAAMALSIYVLATAFGPLFIGPLTEVYGRQVVLHASNIWFLVWNITCGFANSKRFLIAARFLAGFGASSIYALAGGVLGDVWGPEERGQSLGWYLAIPLIAVAAGPILGGVITAHASWRWMFWSTSIFQAVMIIFCFTTFRETYVPVILKRRAEHLRRQAGRPHEGYQTLEERLHRQKSLPATLFRALSRPLRLLATHPIIQVCAVIAAFNYGILYIVLTSFAHLWVSQYRMSVELSGMHYIACALGELVGAQIGGPLIDWSYRRKLARSPEHLPEFRVPLIFPGAIISCLGLFVYGWAAQYHVHWLAVDVGIFMSMFGMQLMGLPLKAYVMDSYPDHTGSALAASQFLESLTAFLFPLFAPSMYDALGYGWGNSTLAFAGLVFGVPTPLILWFFGARLRKRAQSSY